MLLGWGQGFPWVSGHRNKTGFLYTRGKGMVIGRATIRVCHGCPFRLLTRKLGPRGGRGTFQVTQPVMTTQSVLFLWYHAEICCISIWITSAFCPRNRNSLPFPCLLRLPYLGWIGEERSSYALVIFFPLPHPQSHISLSFLRLFTPVNFEMLIWYNSKFWDKLRSKTNQENLEFLPDAWSKEKNGHCLDVACLKWGNAKRVRGRKYWPDCSIL